ncbi:hypothetical protein [Pseudobutyrivibrio xylanivorans]|uniref:Glycosyltransferase RgtA/B/C/D-like domain-containing protein n=1 Tax=Pseudobutyrivibrio xylanivorans TaxID=185007 RepID=A0A5P6VNH6_PSEXY|nr:hypothetical protein [Pseudobutyrivibrio xylanivorans]QFJ53962.1 hypothetical protein FXF36_03295 [Pseudobutyrivibrio xylanivorans]
MGELFEEKKGIIHFLIAAVILVWTVVTLQYGLPAEERGLMALYKSIYQGQHGLVDGWESVQTGGLLTYPLIALYYQVLQPLFADLSLNIGLVLFMRYCYILVRLIVAIYVFCTFRNSDFEDGAFPAALLYFTFILGWKDFSHHTFCDFGMMLIICFIMRFYDNRKPVYAALTALTASITVVAYPPMLIMAVFLGAYWLLMCIKDEAPRSTFISYMIICILLGIAVVLYLQFTVSWGDILTQLPAMINKDNPEPMYIRFGQTMVNYLCLAVIAYLPVCIIRIWDRLKGISEETERALFTLYFIVFMGATFLYKTDGIGASQLVPGCLIIFFWFPYFMREKEVSSYTRIGSYRNAGAETKVILWTIFIFSAVAQLIWAFFAEDGVAVSGHMALYVVMIMILLFAKEEVEYRGLITILLLLSIFFNGIWVANGNGSFSHVFKPMYYTTRGDVQGIALEEQDFFTYEEEMELLEELDSNGE